MTQKDSEVALDHVLDLLKTKVPAPIGNALDALMASDNGIDPTHFSVTTVVNNVVNTVTEQVKEVAKEKAAEVVETAVEAVEERVKASWEKRQSNRPMGVIVTTGLTQLKNWFMSFFKKG